MRQAKKKHVRDTKLVQQAMIDYGELGLDAVARYEVCSRFVSIMAPRCMKGTGSPYGNFGSFKSADAAFFFKYCVWIFDGIEGIRANRLATMKKIFLLARLCMRRTIPADVKDKIGLFFTEQVLINIIFVSIYIFIVSI